MNKTELHKQICEQLTQTYEAKNHDYGDSFSVLRREYSNAILIRIFDKYSRLKTLIDKEAKVDESIDDTLMDLANYCIMELVERRSGKVVNITGEDTFYSNMEKKYEEYLIKSYQNVNPFIKREDRKN